MTPGGEVPDADAVGLRLRVTSQDSDRSSALSARIFRNGRPEPGYDVDRPWDRGARTETLDLLTPYGRAGFTLDPGDYRLEVYRDGSTRAEIEWTVPEDARATLHLTADELLALLRDDGMECVEAGEGDHRPRTDCELSSPDGRWHLKAEVSRDPHGGIGRLFLQADSLTDPPVAPHARPFFGRIVTELYGEERAPEAIGWLRRQGEEYAQLRIAGTYLTAYGEGEAFRFLEIVPVEP